MKEHVRRHGKYIDMLLFGLLAEEWAIEGQSFHNFPYIFGVIL